jgi:subtilisin family serine protease
VIFLLNRIDEELGVGIATPDQVLTAANGSLSPCSATEPQPVYPPVELNPARCAGNGGARVRIFLADTGLLPDAAEKFDWLHGVDGEKDLRTGAGGTIVPYEGHGTFVAGVLRCVAPEAEVYVANIFNTAGSALESDFVLRLNAAFGFGFEILHLTASCMTRKNVQLIALEAWLEQLQSYKGVVCIAPAGNNHTRRPSWPGALPGVISVGALAADLHSRAQFSDYGSWVNVYAPGENLINAFASGTYTCEIPPFVGQQRTFSGRALWSGTSFSAPIVTGLIAARMARRGESGKEAVAALLDRARAQTIPGVGPVLLPCCDDEDGNCGGHDCGGCVDCGCGRGDCDGCGGHGHRSRGHCGCGRCGHDKPGGRRW